MLFEINHSVQLALIELNNGNRRLEFYIMGWDISHCGWLALGENPNGGPTYHLSKYLNL